MSWMLFPDNPALSFLIIVAVAIPLLYAARRSMHGFIYATLRAASGSLRLGAKWLSRAADELRARNKSVLLAHGREEVTQAIDREFDRVTAQIQRDLSGYPALQRRLLDELTRVEEDYKKCGEVPPPPPEWVQAVEVIGKIKNSGDGLAQKLLEDIAKSVDGIYEKVVAEYRRAYEQRHGILQGFMPFWRSLEQTLARVDRNVVGLQQSGERIDALVDKYQQIQAGSEQVEHSLTASAMTQLVIATVVLAVAFGGAFVNFWLIARPMAAMVGGGEYLIGGIEASQVAALVIILVEATMGLFLMETLRITHLFPRINNLTDDLRHRMMWVAFAILLILAGVEVALAVMRDQIITADIALKRGLGSAEAAVVVDLGWVGKIPVAGQMILGFVLPFALAFVAIPLEYFILSARTVLGAAFVLLLRGVGFVLRILAGICKHVGVALQMLYDALIFLPLWIEQMIQSKSRDAATDKSHAAPPLDDPVALRHGGHRP
jgi:hypothetical protein